MLLSPPVYVVRRLLLIGSVALVGCVPLPQIQATKNPLEDLAVPRNWSTIESREDLGSGAVYPPIRGGLRALFNDPQLDSIVEKTLSNNIDLSIAGLIFEQAGIRAAIAGASLFPSIAATVDGSTASSARNQSTRDFNIGADVAWELDLWGRLREQRKASRLAAAVSADDLERAKDSLAAQTMQTWFYLMTAQQQYRLQNLRIESLKSTETSVVQRYVSGLQSLTGLIAVQTSRAQARNVQLQQEAQISQLKRQLKVLMGEYPSADVLLKGQLPVLSTEIPAGLPAHILSSRPDLKAAWSRVLAADANTQVSYRSMFPRISLTGRSGKQSSDFSDLMSQPSAWNIAANLSVPLFNAGRLKNLYQIQHKQGQQTYLNYLNVSLNAYQEVESALTQENNLKNRELALAQALVYAKRTYHNARMDYQSGAIHIINLLAIQLGVFDAESGLLEVRNARVQNRITLSLALGHGV